MTTPGPDTEETKRGPLIDLPRLGLVVGTALVIIAALYFGTNYASSHGYETSLFGYGFLLMVPFVAMLVFVALCRVYFHSGAPTGLHAIAITLALVIIILLAAIASPALICLAIAAPLWLVGAIVGAFASQLVIKHPPATQVLLIASLVGATAIALWLEPRMGYPTDRYTVVRSVEIDASPEAIWPHLLALADFKAGEGRWNVSQDILGVPRPVAAIVNGEGVGAIRSARWQRDVWFEEHITTWKPGKQLEWKFVFPEGSTFTAVDQHIDPRGPNLVVETGGYKLTPLPNGSTRLDLFTTYKANTAVNAYSSLWGDLVIGDVQTNILAIVKGRARASANEPAVSSSLIAAN